MAETDIKAKCYDCKHFVDEGAHLGICKRFPKAENKHKNDWCGEFQAKQVELVALPVVEMQQTDEKPVEIPTLAPKKQRGRPKKEGGNA